MELKGIDVSKHNGNIDWTVVNKKIDFAMLRAGYGNKIDTKFEYNSKECEKYGIPYGVYWFSYATTAKEAQQEAQNCIRAIRDKKVTFPVCFDFEYDSVSYASKKGVTITKNKMIEIALSFLYEIEKAGYYAMNYTNVDFLKRGFSEIQERFDTWVACWGKKPSGKYSIWQYSSTGSVPGISGNVDLNISYKNFNEPYYPTYDVKEIVNSMPQAWFTKYRILAESVIQGDYGTGEKRKKAIQQAGYDYSLVQHIVNTIIG